MFDPSTNPGFNDSFQAKQNAEPQKDFRFGLEYIVNDDGVLVGSGYRCGTTSECASGYACVNGWCVRLNVGTSTGGSSASPGNCSQGGGLPSPCNAGGLSSCQSDPNCGKGYDPTECCGSIVYVPIGAGGGIIAICNGEEKLNARCSPFCDAYYESLGEIAAGCNDALICNDGCTYCDSGGLDTPASCQRLANAPCWCSDNSCGDCQVCETGPTSPNFGQCGTPANEADRCKVCEDIKYTCPCGQVVEASACASTKTKAREEARKKGSAECQEKYPFKYIKQPGGGYATAGGETVTFDTVVAECEKECTAELECHCHSECASGTCSGGRCA